MTKPDEIARIEQQIDEVNDEIERKRESLKRARRNGDARREAVIESAIGALKDRRAALKVERKRVKRLHERMPSQVVGKFVALVVDEDAARDYFEAEFEDQAGAVIFGNRTPDEALDIALHRIAREAHVIFNFSKVPLIGGWLELHDDDLFEWAIPAIARLGRATFEAWRARRDKLTPSNPDAP